MPPRFVVGWFLAGASASGLCAATGFLVPYTLACTKAPHDRFSASYHALLVVLVAPICAIIGGAMAVATYAFDANPWPVIVTWGLASGAIQVAAVLGGSMG